MALCPFAVKKLIAPGSNDPKITVRVGIWHIAVTDAVSLYDYFHDRSGGVESHFYIRWSGVIEQYRDTDYEADANYRANPFAASVESQGWGAGLWTPQQIDSSKRLMRWLHKQHGVPYQKTVAWNGRGFGYHSLFEEWSNVSGKTCPGPLRIRQFDTVLVPWLKAGAPVDREPTLNITTALQAKTTEERVDALQKIVKYGSDDSATVAATWLDALEAIEEARAVAREMRQDLKQLEIKV